MRAFSRLSIVLSMAAGIVALVGQLEKRYAPRLPRAQPYIYDVTTEDPPTSDALAARATDNWDRGPEVLPPSTNEKDAARSLSEYRPPACNTPMQAGDAPAKKMPSFVIHIPAAIPTAESAVASTGAVESTQHAPKQSAVESLSFNQEMPKPVARTMSDAASGVDPIELVRQLQGADKDTAARIRADLVRSGFTEVDIDLARRLLDPDPAVRRQLAQALPKLQSVDAAPWLMRLSKDENADVRMMAISLMATTGDANLLSQVELIAQGDSDERIRQLAEHIGQQRELAGGRGVTQRARSTARW